MAKIKVRKQDPDVKRPPDLGGAAQTRMQLLTLLLVPFLFHWFTPPQASADSDQPVWADSLGKK